MYDPSEALLQLGLYDYVWGNPSLLQTYNSNVQAEKARREQMAYNNMWKNIELKKIAAEKLKEEQKAQEEQAKALAQEEKDKEVKLAKLYQDYNNASGEQERAYIRKQITALGGEKSKVGNEMLDAYDKDKKAAADAKAIEAERHTKALKEMGKLYQNLRLAKTAKDKESLAQTIYDKKMYPDMNRSERDKMYAEVMGIKTVGEKIKESNEGAIASHSGKKTGESLEEQDLKNKATAAINANTPPSALDEEVLNAIRTLGHSWNGTNWFKR